jgi:hypothetical protein
MSYPKQIWPAAANAHIVKDIADQFYRPWLCTVLEPLPGLEFDHAYKRPPQEGNCGKNVSSAETISNAICPTADALPPSTACRSTSS